jgi:hypothetical protein
MDYSIARSGSNLYWITGMSSGVLSGSAPSSNTFHVLTADLSSTGDESGSKNLWSDGTLLASGEYTTKAAATADALAIGRQGHSATDCMMGDVAELLIYNRTLTASELNGVGYYLAQKYDVTTSYVVPEPGTLVLLATGLVGLLAHAWRKRR